MNSTDSFRALDGDGWCEQNSSSSFGRVVRRDQWILVALDGHAWSRLVADETQDRFKCKWTRWRIVRRTALRLLAAPFDTT